MWGKGNTCALLVEKKVWLIFKKLKIQLIYDPAIPFLGIYLKKMKTLVQNGICTLCSL